MKRTQLNVSLDPQLLEKIKEAAKISGKSLVEFVSDCFKSQLGEISCDSIDSRFIKIEERLQTIEEHIASLGYQSQNTQKLTSQEIQKFHQFIKAIFKKESERKGYRSTQAAWDDFINHLSCFNQWDEKFSFRLKESLLIDHSDPLNSDEIESLKKGDVCPYPIRTGIINWINNSAKGKCCCSDLNFPSQETIYQKGSLLVEDLYS